MKKELLAGVTLVSALSVGLVTQAEEVATEATVNTRVTQEQVDQAKDTAAASQVVAEELAQQVRDQETVVAQQGELVEAAKSELGQAEDTVEAAEKLAAGATVEAIDQAEKDLESAKANLTEKTEALDKLKAEAKIAEQEAAVKEQEGVVTSKEAAVAERKAELADDESELAKAKKAVQDNADAIKANQNGQTELTKQLAEANQAVQAAEEVLKKAEEAERAKNEQLKQAEETLKLAKDNLSTKETELTQAEGQLNKAKETTKSAQEALASLEAQYGVKQTITVPDKYVELLTKYAKGVDYEAYFGHLNFSDYYDRWLKRIEALGYQSWTAPDEHKWANSPELAEYRTLQEEAQQRYRADSNALRDALDKELRPEAIKIREMNAYRSTEVTDETTYDTYALSKDTIADLSNFAASLINGVREQFGTVPAVVSPTSVDFVDLVTNQVIADGFRGGHYHEALSDVAKQLGVNYKGESWHSNFLSRMATMDQMRRTVYYNVIGWLTELITKSNPNRDSQGWGHARHMAGVNNSADAKFEYVGIDFATTGTYFDSIWGDEEQEKAIIENKYDAYAKLLTEAQSTLSQAQAAEATEQEAYDQALSNRDKAQALVVAAEKKIDDLKALVTSLTETRSQLAQAKSNQETLTNQLTAEKGKLADLQKAAETLAEAVTTIEGYVKAAKVALNDSELALKTEQETLAKRRAQLDETSKKLKAAETKVSTAREAVASAEKFLSQLKDAKVALSTAREKLTVAQRSYGEKLTVLNNEQGQLVAKRLKLAEAIRQAGRDKEHYEHLLALLNQERLAAKKESIISAGQLPQEVFDTKGQLVDYIARPKPKSSGKIGSGVGVVARPATQTQAPTYPRASQVASSSAAKLPSTNEAGLLVGLLGTALSSLGLSGLKRRKD